MHEDIPALWGIPRSIVERTTMCFLLFPQACEEEVIHAPELHGMTADIW